MEPPRDLLSRMNISYVMDPIPQVHSVHQKESETTESTESITVESNVVSSGSRRFKRKFSELNKENTYPLQEPFNVLQECRPLIEGKRVKLFQMSHSDETLLLKTFNFDNGTSAVLTAKNIHYFVGSTLVTENKNTNYFAINYKDGSSSYFRFLSDGKSAIGYFKV